ncbi:MAG: lipid-A-disaccharide synthase [Pseudomonadota bacterium]
MKRLFVIAGEPSGDRLGGAILAALRDLAPGLEVAGVGGPAMAAAGLSSLFDINETSVMGFTEVVSRLPTIAVRMRETTAAAVAFRPDALLTIDSPSFSLRVAARIRRALPRPEGPVTVHYVAPSVWAWRPGRAARMARHTDHVLALLPFEPPYMRAAGMTCDFVGHPLAGQPVASAAEVAAFRAAHGLGRRPVLLVAPGSRLGEVRRLGGIFADTIDRLRLDRPDLGVIVPVAETVVPEVTARFPGAVLVAPTVAGAERRAAFGAADVALLKSGTITVEAAAAGVPQVAAYRASTISAAIARRLLRIDTGNLVNLSVGWESGARPVPEFYQEACTPDRLAGALAPLFADGPARAAQVEAAGAAMAALGRGGAPPGERAARSLLAAVAARQGG